MLLPQHSRSKRQAAVFSSGETAAYLVLGYGAVLYEESFRHWHVGKNLLQYRETVTNMRVREPP